MPLKHLWRCTRFVILRTQFNSGQRLQFLGNKMNPKELVIGKMYQYFSHSRGKNINVIYEGKRNNIYIFRTNELNEVWSYDLVGITIYQ